MMADSTKKILHVYKGIYEYVYIQNLRHTCAIHPFLATVSPYMQNQMLGRSSSHHHVFYERNYTLP